jgi:hypothetical protein
VFQDIGPTVNRQNDLDQDSGDISHCEEKSNEPPMVTIKVEDIRSLGDAQHEYTEEEYLEEERLEEENNVSC